jgi:hypothetical protein
VIKEIPDHDIYGYHTKEFARRTFVDDFKFETVPLGHDRDEECIVHAFSFSRNTTHYDFDADFCNIYNVFKTSGLDFEHPVADDCQYMPADIRTCAGEPPAFPHCELNALFEGDCPELYNTIMHDMNNTKMGNHIFHTEAEYSRVNHSIFGQAIAKFGNYTWVDDMGFDFVPLRPAAGQQACVLHSYSYSRNESNYDHDANFCNIYDVLNATRKKFEHPVLQDCPFFPVDKETCHIVSPAPAEAPVGLIAESLQIGPEDVAELIAGIVEGMIGKNDLPAIQQCLTDSSGLEKEISEAIADFEKGDVGDIIAGIQIMVGVVQEFPKDLQDCQGIEGDIKRIEKWAGIFTNPQKLVETLIQNTIKNHSVVMADVSKIQADSAAGKWMAVGQDIGDLLVLELGPVPSGSNFIQ